VNTPNDASDTALNRLVDEAERALPIAPESVLHADNVANRQLADVRDYLSITETTLTDSQFEYIRKCLVCAYTRGVIDEIERAS
jgi:hypothetical protein